MKKGSGKQKIMIKKIENPQYRAVCFSKRRKGLFKKAQELSSLSGAQIALLVQSQTGRFFAHGSPSFDSIVDRFLQTNPSDDPSQIVVHQNMSTPIAEKEMKSTNSDELEPWRFWLDLNAEPLNSVEEIAELMVKLEELQSKVASRIKARELEFVQSLFA